ncbi:copper radical oxidase [Meredithblackwellia eburnea MCA 4105]
MVSHSFTTLVLLLHLIPLSHATAASIPALSLEQASLGSHALFNDNSNKKSGLDADTNFSKRRKHRRALGKAWTGNTKLATAGQSGVAAMQISVVSNDEILIYDKSEGNALQVNGHSAWGAIYTISTSKVRPLDLKTNSFCAGGGWLGNGTLVSVGGNPREGTYKGDVAENGLGAIRLFTPGNNEQVYENPSRIRLTSKRWYASTVRIGDGYNNAPATDNPTFEYYPPKGDGLQIYSKFLHDALNTNLFPVIYFLPGGNLFVAANTMAMIYNMKTKTESRLKTIPNGVRVTYPASAASALLPLTVANNWTPEVLFCGGSTADTEINPVKLSSQDPASSQCVRMVLSTAGMKAGWSVETMPELRVMGDGILTPDGKVFIVNGAKSGIAGYGNVADEIGASNAANPDFRPTLYDPVAAKGSRFSTNFPTSNIERLYHSSATLIPDGRIFVSGSNPNSGVSTTTYATRYVNEMFSPPYMTQIRPNFSGLPSNILYGESYTININVLASAKSVRCVIMDLGYSTHGVHMNNRLVELEATRPSYSKKKLIIKGPRLNSIYPPGYAWLFILHDDVPSEGTRVMIGGGDGPPVDQAAIKNMLTKTAQVTK